MGSGRLDAPPADAPRNAPPRAGRARTRRGWSTFACVAVIVVTCCAAVGLHVAQFSRLGPLDEQAHLDDVNRLLDGRFPALGDKVGGETLEQVACRGIETPAGPGRSPNCDRKLGPGDLPEHGNSYEAAQPPLYYAVTALVSKVMPGDDVDSIRLVGALWLSAGAVGLYFALQRLRVAPWLAVAICLVFALVPPIWFAASVVSNDIAVWAFGGVALWATVWLLQTTARLWVQAVVAAAVGVGGALVKPTALLVVLALALALLIQCWSAKEVRRGLVVAGAMVAGAVVATGVWGLIVVALESRPMSQVDPWSTYRVPTLHIAELVQRPLFNLISPLKAFTPAGWRFDWVMRTVSEGALYLHVGLLALPLLAVWPRNESRGIGLAYCVAVVVSGPYYVTLYYVSAHILYSTEPRFAFGLVPMLAVLLACWVPHRWQRWSVTGLLAVPVLWYFLLVSGAVTAAA